MSSSKVLSTVLLLLAGTVFLFKVFAGFLPHFVRVPPVKWRLRVNNAIKAAEEATNKIPAINFGWKCGSVRRQMILASFKPSDYTNKVYGSRIHVGAEDRKNRESFVNRLVPSKRPYKRVIYGYFHPYCDAGGGGEKVLWKAVETTLQRDPNCVTAIYTGDNESSGSDILANVAKRFGYQLDSSRVVFIYLKSRHWVDPQTWPRLTLLGQALGSVILTIEALYRMTPDMWCETMGYPFSYPIVKWIARIPVITYTHYPIISSDMLDKLALMPGFRKSLRLRLKYLYWKSFMMLYRSTGRYVDIANTNSTWTQNHIKKIWLNCDERIIYPPCSTENLVFEEDTIKWSRENQAVIIAQFRPEKRHSLIISSYASALKENLSENEINLPKLIFIGSTRTEDDRSFVKELTKLCFEDYKIPQNLVDFKIDCEYNVMKDYLRKSTYGINAMWNEHFGIAVVEYAASGLISLVHASAGPLLDIVVPWDTTSNQQVSDHTDRTRTGFFFKDPSDPDFAKGDSENYSSLKDTFLQIAKLSNEEKQVISQRSKQCVLSKFSDDTFSKKWNRVLDDLPEIDFSRQ
ncbi:LAME_0G13168g1_1 [Lachancea meyersii CBS 8951]|uniref:GDP-Man:Man(3)GlcNAc(2)-PP-Dol alpha-1,2-mannosyltransferase n=1 Tax=Lachancea meyersii CBS 8951 TaxID=1266667 RepID=A0A1G4KA03_9SACH|nr:LAME_0G13168g1_1 [Lachancea meyersii CBS 8951]